MTTDTRIWVSIQSNSSCC